jgi:hypothetical protein
MSAKVLLVMLTQIVLTAMVLMHVIVQRGTKATEQSAQVTLKKLFIALHSIRRSSGETSPTFDHANSNLNHYVIHFFRN